MSTVIWACLAAYWLLAFAMLGGFGFWLWKHRRDLRRVNARDRELVGRVRAGRLGGEG